MNMATNEIPVEEARDRRPIELTPTSAEIYPFTACRDRVIFEDIIANTNILPFNTSAMDGFSMTFADVHYASPEAHVHLNIVDDHPAGGWRTDRFARGEASRIATGAPLPIGCDVVLPLEWIRMW